MVAMVTETWSGSNSKSYTKKAVYESKLFSLCAFVSLTMELTK